MVIFSYFLYFCPFSNKNFIFAPPALYLTMDNLYSTDYLRSMWAWYRSRGYLCCSKGYPRRLWCSGWWKRSSHKCNEHRSALGMLSYFTNTQITANLLRNGDVVNDLLGLLQTRPLELRLILEFVFGKPLCQHLDCFQLRGASPSPLDISIQYHICKC